MVQNFLESYASVMNCKIIKLHFIYLGIPVGANPRKEETGGANYGENYRETTILEAQNSIFYGKGLPNKFDNFFSPFILLVFFLDAQRNDKKDREIEIFFL